jgi:pimeloyl-ACP methyl ester carboxylesterase
MPLKRCITVLALGLSLAGCALESRFYQPSQRDFPTPEGYQDLTIVAAGNARLHGWFIPAPSIASGRASSAPALVFCHGSATTIDELAPKLEPIRDKADCSLVLFSYRGYGRSTPRESVTRRTTVQDTRRVLDELHKRPDVEAIVLMGYSLGAVPALSVAAEKQYVDGVIVGGAYSRAKLALGDIGSSIIYPLVGGAFDPARSVADLGDRPLFIFHAQDDTSAPVYHAYLIAAAASRAGIPLTLRVVPGASHFDVLDRAPDLLDEIADFIRGLERSGAR